MKFLEKNKNYQFNQLQNLYDVSELLDQVLVQLSEESLNQTGRNPISFS